jgi:putative ABC transport system permease protein
MFWLAWKTLIHERVRLLVTVLGITFATILVLAQVGVYLGMVGNATAIIRHTDADIWVAPKNIRNFDFGNPVPEVRINKVKSSPEVLWAEKLIATWGFLKLANGGQEQVQIIGFNPDTLVGAPWSMIEGGPEEVKGGRYMIIDKTSEKRLGQLKTGTLWELSGKRLRLVGLCEGIRSFTTTPVVFMAFNQVQHLGNGLIHPFETTYIVAKLKDKRQSREVAAALAKTLTQNDVMTKNEFIFRTVAYWTIQTGVGMSFFLTAILGLMIGGAIVGQTIYANTIQHLKEYGTLKAMGASNRDIYKTIFGQAGISAVAGYTLGALVILVSRAGIEQMGVPLYVDGLLLTALFIIIVLSCLFSATFSVKKIRTLDPAMVFRG